MARRSWRTRKAEIALIALSVLLPATAAAIHFWILPPILR
jgi:hypothetical protein